MHTILAVDDSETMREMVRLTLESAQYRVVLACDGVEGLGKFIAHDNVDLVITDINMPHLDGLGLIREIRRLNADVPILALTTETEDHMRQQGAEAGANGWMVKPFKPGQFLAIVRQVMAK